MKFGKQLNLKANPSWKIHYVDYKSLKQLVNSLKQTNHSDDNILNEKLLTELAKVNSFIISEELAAKNTLSTLENEWNENMNGMQKDIWIKKMHRLCSQLEEVGSFICLNHTAFSKILKKIDKHLNLHLKDELMAIINESYFVKSQTRGQLVLAAKKKLVSTLAISQRDRLSFSGEIVTSEVHTYDTFNMEALPVGLSRMWIRLTTDGLSQSIAIPIIVAKGFYKGPILGLTAALHGNELNGIPLTHRLFRELDCSQLSGTIAAVIVSNVPGYLRNQRDFSDGTDLNRVFPGKKAGTAAQVYVYTLMEKIVDKFDYLLDLHTASAGRINSLYVRTDMNNDVTRRMARLQNPQIIVHNIGFDKSLRGAAMERGIPAITVEIGNPQRFQERFIQFALLGVENILCSLEMVPREPQRPDYEPVVCSKSFWIFTTSGGILEVLCDINSYIKEGELIARICDIFGDETEEYYAPADGIVVGKSINPVCQTGDRILHLGVFGGNFLAISDDGHL